MQQQHYMGDKKAELNKDCDWFGKAFVTIRFKQIAYK